MTTVKRSGYILEVTDSKLTVNGQIMPVTAGIDAALYTLFDQLGQITRNRTPDQGPLSIQLNDVRPDGFGTVTQDVPAGHPVQLDAFAPRRQIEEEIKEAEAEAHPEPDLQVAPEEPKADSIFAAATPIDERVRVPISQGITAQQRERGFFLRSNSAGAVEQRVFKRRRLWRLCLAAVLIVALVRVVFALLAGGTQDFAAICVDARTSVRAENAVCVEAKNPYANWVYFAEGETVPQAGEQVDGGTRDRPEESGVINEDLPEDRGGVIAEGGALEG